MEILGPIIDEELTEIILFELHSIDPTGSDLKDVRNIVGGYSIKARRDQLERITKDLRKDFFIRQDPNEVFRVALTDAGVRHVNETIIPKHSTIKNLDRSRIESLIQGTGTSQEFRVEALEEGFKVEFFPESLVSRYFFTAFRRRNAYYDLQSDPEIEIYRRSDVGAIYRAFEKWLTLIKKNSARQTPLDEKLKEIQKAIEKEKLPYSLFRVETMQEGNFLITVADTPDDQIFFKLTKKERYEIRYSAPGSQPQIEAKDWTEVMRWIERWLDEIRNLSVFVTEFVKNISQAKQLRKQEGPSDFTFRNEEIRGALGVDAQAQIFLKLLQSISKAESGTLLGIFGKWGRGKTYFWRKLKECFQKQSGEPNAVKYIPVEFHAWKYQDTPASWAYLYETFVSNFYKEPRRILRLGKRSFFSPLWLSEIINRFRLNLKRLGRFLFIYFVGVLTFGLVWYFGLDFEEKGELLVKIIRTVGITTVLSVVCFLILYSGTAKDLIRKYFSKHSFANFLGAQAEIQKDFVLLFRTWIPDGENKKRIVLFVDDIDRCSEERIIEVIDALKIMMDDVEIAERVIVIAAIDESVLKRAIKLKYFKMIVRDIGLSKEERMNVQDQLCREYMDKLFLNGFRLSGLRREEKIEILKAATPRSIRIFYYRYQLAKYFSAMLVAEGTSIYTEWQLFSDRERAILPHLIVEYSTEKKHRQLTDTIDAISGPPEELIAIHSLKTKFVLSKGLYCALLKIVEIVVPY